MKLETLRQLFEDQLADVYSAEKQIVKSFSKAAKAATAPELAKALQEHLEATKDHVTRIEEIFGAMGMSPREKKCKGMEGLLAESEEVVSGKGEPEVIDAGLIAAAQRVEHYEIAAYGTLRAYAEQLDENEAADLLQQTLDDEKDADEKLSEIAEGFINVAAMDPRGRTV